MIPLLESGLAQLRAYYGLTPAGAETSPEVAAIAGELLHISGETIAAIVDHNAAAALADKIRSVAASALGQKVG
jgi:hypothetical protein